MTHSAKMANVITMVVAFGIAGCGRSKVEEKKADAEKSTIVSTQPTPTTVAPLSVNVSPVTVQPPFRKELFEKAIRHAIAFNSDEIRKDLQNEIKYLKLQVSSQPEKDVLATIEIIDTFQTAQVGLTFAKKKTNEFIKLFDDFVAEAPAMLRQARQIRVLVEDIEARHTLIVPILDELKVAKSKGYILVQTGDVVPTIYSNIAGYSDQCESFNDICSDTILKNGAVTVDGPQAGLKYVSLIETEKIFRAAAQAATETASEMINNGGMLK